MCEALVNEQSICGKKFVWSHGVDQTNGDGEPARLEVSEAVKTKECPTCHHQEVIAEVRYKIPDDQGVKGNPNSYWDSFVGQFPDGVEG